MLIRRGKPGWTSTHVHQPRRLQRLTTEHHRPTAADLPLARNASTLGSPSTADGVWLNTLTCSATNTA